MRGNVGQPLELPMFVPDRRIAEVACPPLLAQMPTLVWPTNSLSGDTLLRKSHICSVGERSSSDATTSCVATSGFHCRMDARRRLRAQTVTEHDHKAVNGCVETLTVLRDECAMHTTAPCLYS